MLLHKLFKKGSASGLAGRPRSLHADARKVCSLVPHCTATKAHFAGRANLLSAEEYLQEARDMRLGSPRAAELSPVTSESSGVKLQYVNLVMEGDPAIGWVGTQTNNTPDVVVHCLCTLAAAQHLLQHSNHT